MANDIIAIASDICSLLQRILIKSNGKEIYEADDLNCFMITRNLLEYTKEYGSSAGQTSLFYPYKVRGIDTAKYITANTSHAVLSDNDTYNENYYKRMIIAKSGDIHCIIDLKNFRVHSIIL